MNISNRGLRLVKSFEALRLTAYRDGGGVLTIGYGHTGADVHPGQVIAEAQADSLLRLDVSVAEHALNIGVRVPLNQNKFDALVSFAFNVGVGNFLKSSLRELLNEGKFDEAVGQFARWIHDAKGEVEPGLVRRRQEEAMLFKEVV